MSDRPETAHPQDTDSKLSRRELIKKGLAFGSIGYVAPMIIGAVTPVSAQGISGLGCTATFDDCEEDPPPEAFCDEQIPCLCFPTVSGSTACVVAIEECPEVTCDSNSDCDSDEVCVSIEGIDNCDEACGGDVQFCVPLCSSVGTLTQQGTRSGWPALGSLR